MRSIFALALLSFAVVLSEIPRALTAQETKPKAETKPNAEAKPDDAATAEEQKQRQAAERFRGVLEKNPRRGTALDRLYGYYVEAGTLDELIKTYTARTEANPQDGTAWMILGLIESQRGRDAAAVAAFRQAEPLLPQNALASYYLGQALVLVGQPDDAAQALERAIARKPPRADLLDAFQALGRVYQRAQKSEQALAVWGRLEQLFPDDLRVQEQIASTLVEEGQYEQALPRFEALVQRVKDDYRIATYRVEAADIKVRLGRGKEALADFEKLLSQLNPDNWLFRDVRRRIEEIFLRTDDQAGLAAYYEDWVSRHKDDVEAVARLARILAGLGRVPEARSWLEKALKLAPSRKDLRLALIEQLVEERQYPQAVEQYALLAQHDPNNSDHLREWGRLILKDASRPEAERKQAAAAVWRRLVEARPNDSLTATQVADLFRQAEMSDEALELYKRAVELSPDSAQYREYLGEYFHTLKREDEALATWREIAAGKLRTAENLARLAEVLAGFGHLDEAIADIRAACKLDDDEFKFALQAAELLSRAEKYDEALTQLDAAHKLAEGDEEVETVLQKRIRNLQLADKLQSQIDGLQQKLAAGTDATAARWFLLSRYLEAARMLPEAAQAIGKALALDDKSIAYQAAAAHISESSGNLQAAADAYRKLASIDRRFRTEHLTNVAKLEAQLGRADQALQAARDLLAAAPGNPEHYEFFAQLCFQLGKTDDGLDALRRSVRLNPTEPKGMLTLAAALADQFRTAEAIELYWRAFDKSAELEARLGIVSRLTELYLQTNQLDRLVDRFERERREPGREREMTICLAQVHQSAGDYGTARQELERLLTQNPRDTQLLQQLSNLSESEGDVSIAAKYQQQLAAIAPERERELRLAQLLMRAGEADEAAALWARLIESEVDPARAITSLDSLLAHDRRDLVLTITERLLRDQSKNWELLYREGVALSASRPQEAERRFREILALRVSDEERGAKAKSQTKQKSAPQASTRATRSTQSFPFQERMQMVYQVRQAAGLDQNNYYRSSGTAYFFGPGDFGQCRMAALGWLLRLADKEGKREEFIAALRAARDKPKADSRDLWDWYYLQLVRQDQKEIYQAIREIALRGEPEAQWLYLVSLAGRATPQNRQVASNRGGATDTTPPLPPDELEQVLTCYRALRERRPELLDSSNYNNQSLRNNVITELRRAQRTAEVDEMFRQAVASADKPAAVLGALQMAVERENLDTTLELFDKWEREQLSKARGAKSAGYYGSGPSDSFAKLMSLRATEKAHADVLRLFERYLTYVERRRQADPNPNRTGKRAAGNNQYAMYPGGSMYVQLWTGKTQRGSRLDYPTPNDYYDQGTIVLLRQAFEIYKRDDLFSDLLTYFKKQADSVPDADRIFWRLALTYVYWWNDEKALAIAEFTRAADLAPADLDLRIELAGMQEKQNDFAAALATADAITPLDHQMMQQRETAALRLAVRLGDTDRARLAAERLFGLRLSAEIQVQLAAQMHQLGMHEQAEAILARAQRQAGRRTSALVSLMNQYQTEQKPELAVQVAHQILRRSAAVLPNPNQGQTEDSLARQQALQVLGRSGKLKELIERAEAQLKTSPESMQIHQRLAEYYQASGDRAKSVEVLERMAQVRPDDARLRYQIGQQLAQAGKAAEALPHYTSAIKKEPGLFANSSWEVQQAFQQANKTDELVQLLDEIDLKSVGQYWSVMNIVQNLVQSQPQHRDAGMKLFRKAWKAFPENRPSMLGSLYNDEVWQLPEIYEDARQALIPSEAVAFNDPWLGMSQEGISYSGDGTVTGLVGRLLQAAGKQNRLDPLRTEIEAALKKFPTWAGGKAIFAVIQARDAKPDAARKIIEELLADKKSPIPPEACWIIGQELDRFDTTRDLARQLYESTIDQQRTQQLEFSYSPIRRLVTIYEKLGEKPKARELVLRLLKGPQNDWQDPQYMAYQRLSNVHSAGSQLIQLGYPIDALRLYREVLGNDQMLQTSQRFGGDHLAKEIQSAYTKAIQDLAAPSQAASLAALLEPQTAAGKQESPVDLVLLVHPADLSRAALTSVVDAVLRAAAKSTEQWQKIETDLAALAKAYPQDIEVNVLTAGAALAVGQEPAVSAALRRLEALVDAAPLEELPASGNANARQRAAAAREIAVWLIARDCLKNPERRALGQKLAERSLAAARRLQEPKFQLAILRELGQILLDQGDRAAAEARWTEMLELVVPRAKAKTPADAAPPPAGPPPAKAALRAAPPPPSQLASATAASAAARPAGAGVGNGATALAAGNAAPARPAGASPAPPRPGAPGKGPPVPVVMPATVAQLTQAAEIAQLAAENDMAALSLRAIREILDRGPPIKEQPKAAQFGVAARSAYSISPQSTEEDNSIPRLVEERVSKLAKTWAAHGVPDADQYEVFATIVFPAARPAEIFLYPRAIVPNDPREQRSVGALLAKAAAKAGRGEDLLRRIAARQEQPLAQMPGQTLRALAAAEAGDDAAIRAALEALLTQLRKDNLQTSAELACHAALASLERETVGAAALPVVELATDRIAEKAQHNVDPAGGLMLRIVSYHLEHNDAAAARKRAQQYLDFGQRQYASYNGDYGIYQRKQQVQRLASEYAQAGLMADVLDMLGQYADLPATENYGDQGGISTTFCSLMHTAERIPAGERYELLKKWSLPLENRQSVRLLATFASRDDAPLEFRKQAIWNRSQQSGLAAAANPAATAASPPASVAGADAEETPDLIMSSAVLLVEAARDANKLDDLAAALVEPVAKKVENAEELALFVTLARGDVAAARAPVEDRLASLLKQVATDDKQTPGARNRQQGGVQWSDYLIARAAIRNPALDPLGERYVRALLDYSRKVANSNYLSYLRRELASAQALRAGAKLKPGDDPGLAWWHPTVHETNVRRAKGEIEGWWVAQEGQIAHVAGSDMDFLYFDYPLAGEFEFSLDAYNGPWGEGNIGYGGLVFEAIRGNAPARIWPVGNHEFLNLYYPPKQSDEFNRLTLQVSAQRVRCLLNDHLVYETTDQSPLSPWLALAAPYAKRTYFRNLTLKGDVRIPREVPLTQGDRMEGWITSFYYASQPPRLTVGTPVQYGDQSNGTSLVTRDPDPEAYHFSAADGVLSSRKSEPQYRAATRPGQSRIYYHRPLRPADTVRYEFFHEPGTSGAHPALGRLAFLLEPDGVRLHWITDGSQISAWSGLKYDNAVVEPENRRGTAPLPLKAGEWNAVRVTLDDDASIELNGVEVYRRALETTNSRQFGFFHFPLTERLQVRNVVLSGNWPEKLTAAQLANLAALDPRRETAGLAGARQRIFDEQIRALNWQRVQARAATLPAPARYELLRSWVLPGPEHATYRLFGGYTPTDSVPAPFASSPAAAAERRIHASGKLTAPVLDLLLVAAELKKLPELEQQAQSAPVQTPTDARSQRAFLALLALARGDTTAAGKLLQQMPEHLAEVPADASEPERWPELVAASEALRVPALIDPSLALLEQMAAQIAQPAEPKAVPERTGGAAQWERRLLALRNHARLLKSGKSGGTNLGLAQWSPVLHGTAESHGRGAAIPEWTRDQHEVRHFAGHAHDLLYFQVPLRGNFEISAQFAARTAKPGENGGALQLAYAATRLGLRDDRKRVEIGRFGVSDGDAAIEPPLPELKEWYDYRLVVQDGKSAAYIDGRQIHEQPLPPNADPWLALYSSAAGTGAVRNLRISGAPTIPDALDLSSADNLSGWLADYFREPISGGKPAWSKQGDEITGPRDPDQAGVHRQTLLRYHRPLLEDGEIEYEFYFEPGKTIVHPALDRRTFLLEPSGVRIHWITDAQFDQNGLAHDNAADEPANRRGPAALPLKAGEWNTLKLALKGDTLTLVLNGAPIYEQPIEGTNQRTFGLFRYVDESAARIRKVSYRGKWPRTLPAVDQQELAGK